jgi:hypothetical protein
MVELYLHSSCVFEAWCLIEHRDNFTFYIIIYVNIYSCVCVCVCVCVGRVEYYIGVRARCYDNLNNRREINAKQSDGTRN